MINLSILLESFLYVIVGLMLYTITFWILVKVSPFNFIKEIEKEQNTAIGVIVAGIFIGISIIIAAAIHG